MHISIFHSIKAPLVGHRFAYTMLTEVYEGCDILAKVAFLNGTAGISGMCLVNINKGTMPSSDDILAVFNGRKFARLESEIILNDLCESLYQESRRRAMDMAKLHVRQLAGELLSWQNTGVLGDGTKLEELASICAEYRLAGDHYQEAERLVTTEALVFTNQATQVE
ncbi:hypothetical protein ACQCLI_32020 (plasmid) [Pseudomonas nitroreducens]|uniref:hypothetical protein n=1 Tax=Pseudomonas nitroreducens TaxID=46680 RepID=UPI000377D4EA|nr:hypothetical protein [Pseudomonas nitroreducens]